MICRCTRSPFGGAVERSETERAVGADIIRPLVGDLQRSAGGHRPPLRETRNEFAEKRWKIGASCAGRRGRRPLRKEEQVDRQGIPHS